MIECYMDQRSPEWIAARTGVVTMSHMKDLLTGGNGVTRRNYILDVASEILSGRPVERYQSEAMLHGQEMEPYALEAFSEKAGFETSEIGFAFLDNDRRIGCSPDALIPAHNGIVEIKCPQPRAHMRYLLRDKNEYTKHAAQMQGAMWILEAEFCYFVSYCPVFTAAPLYLMRYNRDEQEIGIIERAANDAVEQIDEIVDYLRELAPPSKGVSLITKRAMKHLESMNIDPDDVELPE